ncbi:MAG: nitrilase family protein [Bacteroidaceae bacterium]|nr:nitrilase family protein [Bacteroidaceae bacterium]
MRIALLQQDILWADVEANHLSAEQAIMRLQAEADAPEMYVLPEMWSTGYAVEPEGIAETDGRSLSWMRRMAELTDAAIMGSVSTAEGGKYYNRLHFVTPPGSPSASYDKRHLFTYGGEHLRYTAGERRVVAEWRGVRFLLQICYDLRFPVFARNHEDYDAIVYVASWPASRRAVWDILLKARAIENQCYVLAVNRVGSDPACRYDGGTTAIDPYGRTLAICPDNTPSSVVIDLDLDSLNRFREKFPVLRDRDQCRL